MKHQGGFDKWLQVRIMQHMEKKPTNKRTSIILPMEYVDAMHRIREGELIQPSIQIRKGLREFFKQHPKYVRSDSRVWKV